MVTSSNGNIFRVTGHCAGNSPLTGEFHAQRPVTRSFDFFFGLCLNKRLSKQPWGWWFETHRAHYDITVMFVADAWRRTKSEAWLMVSLYVSFTLEHLIWKQIPTTITTCLNKCMQAEALSKWTQGNALHLMIMIWRSHSIQHWVFCILFTKSIIWYHIYNIGINH